MRTLPLWPVMLVMGAAAVFWNYLPLREHSIHVRMKDLSFVPTPVLGRMLCLGQCSACAQLQWIDSFTYFELQLEKRNDRLQGSGESGFRRLYDLLIAEDPYYLAYYEHASFNLGALVSRHDLALGYQLEGISYLPHCTSLWRQAACELYATFELEARHPEQMDAFLNAWADAELDAIQRRQVWDWKEAMGRRHQVGLTQLAYWQEQMSFNQPDSPSGQYILGAMRDQVGRYCVDELEALVASYQQQHLLAPLRLEDVLEPGLVRSRYPKGLPIYLPIAIREHRLVLRCDPFGYPFHLDGTTVISPGIEHWHMDHLVVKLTNQIEAYLQSHPTAGSFPTTVEQVKAWGITVPDIPAEARYEFHPHEQSVVMHWDPPPSSPWTFDADKASLQHEP